MRGFKSRYTKYRQACTERTYYFTTRHNLKLRDMENQR